MEKDVYKVTDGIYSMELFHGELRSDSGPAGSTLPQCNRNEWHILNACGSFPTESSGIHSRAWISNNIMLVNRFDHDRYLFTRGNFIKKLRPPCIACGRPF